MYAPVNHHGGRKGARPEPADWLLNAALLAFAFSTAAVVLAIIVLLILL
jgi:hypothetical protein